MYVESPDAAKAFARALRRSARQFPGVEAAIAPSFTLLPSVVGALKGSTVRVMGQAVSRFADGKHTGEVSARMLSLAGAAGVLVGHSERRAAGESDEDVAEELARAESEGLRAILCVGEAERDAGGAHFSTVASQLRAALRSKPAAARVVIAYEPVWAIGKSAVEAMSAQDVQEMVIYIKKILAESMGRVAALRVPVLYGGSVEKDNARELIEKGGVSGFLVGHASADAHSFLEILRAVRSGSR